MRVPACILTLSLAGCTTTPAADRSWLVGNWCPETSSTTVRGAGVGLWPVRFDSDGTYETFEDHGRWTLRGEQLTRRRPFLDGTYRQEDRVERLGGDRMAWTWEYGERELWRRCSPERAQRRQ